MQRNIKSITKTLNIEKNSVKFVQRRKYLNKFETDNFKLCAPQIQYVLVVKYFHLCLFACAPFFCLSR